jgi:phosphoribosylformylglycinamidine synthase
VLVKMGLLPGAEGSFEQTVTLTANDSNKFEDRWVYLKCPTPKCIFMDEGALVRYPIAHAEGKFVAADERVLDGLEERGQVVFQYVDAGGRPGAYPVNPNGSARDIAGICSESGTVLGLMPHPERHVLPVQHPAWTREGLKEEGDGLALFRNAIDHVKG